MRLNVIAFKNNKLGCSTNPVFIDVPAQAAATQLARSLKVCPEEDAKKYVGLTMFKIAEYDDESMQLEKCEPVMLLDCQTILEPRGLVIKEEENGNSK